MRRLVHETAPRRRVAAGGTSRAQTGPHSAGEGAPRHPQWWLWLMPLVALTALLTVYPALDAIRLSAFEWKGYGEETWVGARNYERLVNDRVALRALSNTIFFSVVTTVGTVVVGTVIAMLINRRLPLSRFFKAVIFLPVILPVVFTGLAWVFSLDTNFGWVNGFLRAVSPELAQGWLSDPTLVMWTISITTVFQFAGLPMILVLAGLGDIPQEVQEAATLDGVNGFQRTRHITLPLLRDVLISVTLLQLLAGFRVFDQVYVMTRGGPGTSSEVMSTYVFREAFVQQHFGQGAAAAVVTALLVAVAAMAYMSVFATGKISKS